MPSGNKYVPNRFDAGQTFEAMSQKGVPREQYVDPGVNTPKHQATSIATQTEANPGLTSTSTPTEDLSPKGSEISTQTESSESSSGTNNNGDDMSKTTTNSTGAQQPNTRQGSKGGLDTLETSSVVSSLTNGSVKSQTYSSDGSNDSNVFDQLKLGSRTSSGVGVNFGDSFGGSTPRSPASSFSSVGANTVISTDTNLGSGPGPVPTPALEPTAKSKELTEDHIDAFEQVTDDDGLKAFLNDNNLAINAKNKSQENLLHLAVSQGNTEVVKSLLATEIDGQKINVNEKDSANNTVLHFLDIKGNEEIVKLLLAKTETNLLNELNEAKYTPLHQIIFKKIPKIGKLLIEKGADLGLQNTDNKTPIDLIKELGENDKALKYELIMAVVSKHGKKYDKELGIKDEPVVELGTLVPVTGSSVIEVTTVPVTGSSFTEEVTEDLVGATYHPEKSNTVSGLAKKDIPNAGSMADDEIVVEPLNRDIDVTDPAKVTVLTQDHITQFNALASGGLDKFLSDNKLDTKAVDTEGNNLLHRALYSFDGNEEDSRTKYQEFALALIDKDQKTLETKNKQDKSPLDLINQWDEDKKRPFVESLPEGIKTKHFSEYPGSVPVPSPTTNSEVNSLPQSDSLLSALNKPYNLSFESEYLGSKDPVSGLLDHIDVVKGTRDSWHAPERGDPSNQEYPFTANSEICNTKAYINKVKSAGLNLEAGVPHKIPAENGGPGIFYKSEDESKAVFIPHDGKEYGIPQVKGDALVNIPLKGDGAKGLSLALVYEGGKLVGMKPPVNKEKMFLDEKNQLFIRGEDGNPFRIPMSPETLMSLQEELVNNRGGPDNYQAQQGLKAYRNQFLRAQDRASELKKEECNININLGQFLTNPETNPEQKLQALNQCTDFFIGKFTAAHEAEKQAFRNLVQYEGQSGAIKSDPQLEEFQKRKSKFESYAAVDEYINNRHAELNELRQKHGPEEPSLEEFANALSSEQRGRSDSDLSDSGSSVSGQSNSGSDDDNKSVLSDATDRSSSLSSSSRIRRDSSASDDHYSLDSLSEDGDGPGNTTKNGKRNTRLNRTGAAASREFEGSLRKSLEQGDPESTHLKSGLGGPKGVTVMATRSNSQGSQKPRAAAAAGAKGGVTVVASKESLALTREALEEHKKGSSSPGKVVSVNASTNRHVPKSHNGRSGGCGDEVR